MTKLYSNENFPLPVVKELRRLGHDVLTIQEAGKADQALPDEEVLAFAVDRDRILLTFNRKHFVQLHRKCADHSGIIVCSFDTHFEELAQRIHTVIKGCSDFSGQLFRVNRITS